MEGPNRKQEEQSCSDESGNLLSAFQEVLQIMLFENLRNGEDKDIKLTVAIKQVHQELRTPNEPNVLSIKVSCNQQISLLQFLENNRAPALRNFILSMQKHEDESHCAIQSVYKESDEMKKMTLNLWIHDTVQIEDPNNRVQLVSTHSKAAKANDTPGTIIHMRAFLHLHSVIRVGQELCSVMENLKLFNPEMMLFLTLNAGNTVELELSGSDSLKVDEYCIHWKVFESKYADHYKFGLHQVVCGEVFDVNSPEVGSLNSEKESMRVRCLLLFIPMYRVNENEAVGENTEKEQIPVHIYLQAHGVCGFPLQISRFAAEFFSNPQSYLSFSKFAFHPTKTVSKCSSYSNRLKGRVVRANNLSSQLSTSDHVCLVFAFVIEDAITSSKGLNSCLELNKNIMKKLAAADVSDSLHDSAKSAFIKLFGSDNQQVPSGVKKKSTLQPDVYEKFIPDVVNSLVDIFTRSTNANFRSQVGRLLPTSSRLSMSCHLANILQRIIRGRHCTSVSNQISSHSANESEDDLLDEWEDSQQRTLDRERSERESIETFDNRTNSLLQCGKQPEGEMKGSQLPSLLGEQANSIENEVDLWAQFEEYPSWSGDFRNQPCKENIARCEVQPEISALDGLTSLSFSTAKTETCLRSIDFSGKSGASSFQISNSQTSYQRFSQGRLIDIKCLNDGRDTITSLTAQNISQFSRKSGSLCFSQESRTLPRPHSEDLSYVLHSHSSQDRPSVKDGSQNRHFCRNRSSEIYFSQPASSDVTKLLTEGQRSTFDIDSQKHILGRKRLSQSSVLDSDSSGRFGMLSYADLGSETKKRCLLYTAHDIGDSSKTSDNFVRPIKGNVQDIDNLESMSVAQDVNLSPGSAVYGGFDQPSFEKDMDGDSDWFDDDEIASWKAEMEA